MSEPALLEVLRANLLTETQHEILHVAIYRVAQLRHIVRTRKISMQAMNENAPKQSFSQVQRPRVHELVSSTWNCGASDHRYQECLGEKKIFVVDAGNWKRINHFVLGVMVQKTGGPVHHRAVHAN